MDSDSCIPGPGCVEAMRLAVLTVSPKIEYFGARRPMTPAVPKAAWKGVLSMSSFVHQENKVGQRRFRSAAARETSVS